MFTKNFKSTGKTICGKTLNANFFHEEENAHNCQADNNGVASYHVRDIFEGNRIIGFSVSSERESMIDCVVKSWVKGGYIVELLKLTIRTL